MDIVPLAGYCHLITEGLGSESDILLSGSYWCINKISTNLNCYTKIYVGIIMTNFGGCKVFPFSGGSPVAPT